jgi:hypothetical protein
MSRGWNSIEREEIQGAAPPGAPARNSDDPGPATISTTGPRARANESGLPVTVSSEVESWLREVARVSTSPSEIVEASLDPGARVYRGRFVVQQALGRGGMGAVYAVRDLEMNADVALKVLLDRRPMRLLAFKHEFRALQDVAHVNLVRLDELFEDEGRWFFTMERIRGVRFTTFVRPRGLDVARLRQSLTQLVHGLLALHGAAKVHRDIKPSNTLIEASGRVVLLDFGLISDLRSVGPMLLPGAGTAAYMAPEQLSGEGGPAADWYSVGVMLYEALTGKLPFDGPIPTLLARKLTELPPPPSSLASDLPLDLERLCLDLLQREPASRPDGKEILARVVGEPPTPGRGEDAGSRLFVGRSAELDALRRTYAATAAAGSFALILGDSGVGKTALLDAFLDGLDDPVAALSGRCYEREFVPFKALDGLVDALARRLETLDDNDLRRVLPQSSSGLARIFPVLDRSCRRAGLPTEQMEPSRPTEARAGAFRTLRDLVAKLAERHPVVLTIDDVHWADADSLAAIEDLLYAPLPPRLLIILVGRSGTKVPHASADLVIQLDTLPDQEATELARRLLQQSPGARGADPSWLVEGAGRHPLFMEAIARHSAAVGAPTVRLEDALAARLTDIPAGARTLIELVSTAAQPLSFPALAQATGLPFEPLFRLVRELQSNRLILSRGGEARPSLEPYHDQVRQAITRSMSTERQLTCHRAVAEALEIVAPESFEALAVHWRAAGESDRARVQAIRAGHHARKVLAFDRAATFYHSALELAAPGDAEASELHRWHAEALANAGRTTESAAAYRAAAQLASSDERTDLMRCAAEQQLRAGHFGEGLSAMDEILASMRMTRPAGLVATARMLLKERILEACAALLQRVLPLGARRRRELERRADACWTMALGLASLDPLTSAVFLSRHLRLSRRLGDRVRVALALCMRAPQGAFEGAPARSARRTLARVERMMHGRSEPLVHGYQAVATGVIAFLLGDFDDALQKSEHALELFRGYPGPATWEMATSEKYILDALWHTGRLRTLRERTLSAWRDAIRRGDRYLVVQIETALLPVLHLIDDDVPGAVAALDSALVDWPRPKLSLPHWQHGQTRTLVELYAGRPREALKIMDAQVKATEQVLLSRIQAIRIFSRSLRTGALMGVAARGGDEARTLLRRAARDVRSIERERVAPDIVAMLRGQIEVVLGNRAAAERLFSVAVDLLGRRGMRLYSAVAGYARGFSAGGDAGRAQMADARRWMEGEGIRSPDGFIRLFAPALVDEPTTTRDGLGSRRRHDTCD